MKRGDADTGEKGESLFCPLVTKLRLGHAYPRSLLRRVPNSVLPFTQLTVIPKWPGGGVTQTLL